ncbi:MAG: hypothetical protein WCK00_09285, partial [Deltaproteobacteria bacterium]
IYREELVGAPAWRNLKSAMDLWCACWFWPVDALDHAPLPTTLHTPSPETRAIATRIAAAKRFFHWELEFPDVFCTAGSGFDANLGNPPWDIAKPNSKEFFSNIDPLYRAYGKQEALRYQTDYFADTGIEQTWLDYNADFRAQSNFMSYAASPFGDPRNNENSQDRFAISRGRENDQIHARWRIARAKSRGFADPAHPFRHQGSADINLYKAFLEQTHALLRPDGRLGFIVPSGLYSDHGTGGLRRLFLDHCRWEWLFGFENRDGIFEIHRSFKFNPVIIQEAGATEAIRTAFMRRKLEDWENAETLSTPYSRAQVTRFSPRSMAILEIQSERDLEMLEKIYVNSVLLGDDGPDGWRIEYGRELNVTSDSRLFRPLDYMEEQGYSRTIYGTWVDAHGQEAKPLYEGRMIGQFDCCATRWVRGNGRTAEWEDLPLEMKDFGPQFLIASDHILVSNQIRKVTKFALTRVSSATNCRTVIATVIPDFPSQHSLFTGTVGDRFGIGTLTITGCFNSFVFDFVVRRRCVGVNVTASIIDESPLPKKKVQQLQCYRHWAFNLAKLTWLHPRFSPEWIKIVGSIEDGSAPSVIVHRAIRLSERIRLRCIVDATVAGFYGLNEPDLLWILRECDHQNGQLAITSFSSCLSPHGFWRVDKDKDPELRHTVLTLVAFHDLEEKIRSCEGDREKGIEAFLNQNDGEGWMLPETLRLADYGLGHDERAKHPQPVASRLGPRFYDWQLSQSPEESWRECRLHARNLLGETGYRQLLADIESPEEGQEGQEAPQVSALPAQYDQSNGKQGKLFE